ncbi:MAG: hypothetical protein ABI744_03460 [Chloroflexota bacterium]
MPVREPVVKKGQGDRGVNGHSATYSGRLMESTRISVNPSEDAVFASRVRELGDQINSPEALEDRLRPDYPQVRVVRGVTDVVDRWYVYREGRWIRS